MLAERERHYSMSRSELWLMVTGGVRGDVDTLALSGVTWAHIINTRLLDWYLSQRVAKWLHIVTGDWELILNHNCNLVRNIIPFLQSQTDGKTKANSELRGANQMYKIIKRLWNNIWIIFCYKTRGVMLGMEHVFVANWFMFCVRQLGKHQGNLRSLINIFTMSYHYLGQFILAAEKKNEIQSKEQNANAISQSPLHLKSNIPLSDNNRCKDITYQMFTMTGGVW